jgi:hypothetical protein
MGGPNFNPPAPVQVPMSNPVRYTVADNVVSTVAVTAPASSADTVKIGSGVVGVVTVPPPPNPPTP